MSPLDSVGCEWTVGCLALASNDFEHASAGQRVPVHMSSFHVAGHGLDSTWVSSRFFSSASLSRRPGVLNSLATARVKVRNS